MTTTSSEAVPAPTSLLWINLFANGADQIASVAIPVVYVSQFSGDASATTVLTAAATLPLLLFSLPIGALADRVQPRSILFAGEVVRLLSLVALLMAMRTDSPPILLVAVLALLGGTGTVAFQVGAPAMVARTTAGADRTRLNCSIELARSVAVTAGPPVAGLLVGFAGGTAAFVLCLALVIAAAIAVLRLPRLPLRPATSTPVFQQLIEGWQFTIRNPWLSPILLISLGFNLGWYLVLGVIVAWASLELQMSSIAIGMMFACYGVGMILGAGWMRRYGAGVAQSRLVTVGPWCGLSFAALVALTGVAPAPALLYFAFILVGTGPIVWTITTVGIRQSVTPHELMGRVTATSMTLSAGARPIGAALGYMLFIQGGYALVFIAAFLVFAAQALAIGRSSLTRAPAPVAYVG